MPATHRTHPHRPPEWRRWLAAAIWGGLVLGGIAFFFWIIWDPPS